MRFPFKTALAFTVFVLALGTVHYWRRDLGLSPAIFPQAWRLGSRRTPQPAVISSAAATSPTGVLPRTPQAAVSNSPRPPLAEFLFDDSGSLDTLFTRLLALETNKDPANHVAILHYGDSPTTADLITGDVRALLQQRFGDAGHGYLLPAKPWAWYGHRDTDITAHGWDISTAVGKGHADTYGIGGASFQASAHSASSHITLKDAAQSSMELSFLAQPDGGSLTISANDAEPLATVETAAATSQPAWRTIALPAGTRSIDIKPVSGHVELFGETFTRAQSGLLYDSLGLNGASTTVLSRGFNAEVWTAELQHDAPALVIINYGTNESSSAAFVEKQYESELRSAIRRIRTALPSVSILVMSPMDRGARSGIDEINTMPTIPEIVAIQKRVAADTHCAFFDTFNAMGGDGTIARWYAGRPRLVAADLIHPTPQGAATVAQIFVQNLLHGYEGYKASHAASTATVPPPPQQAVKE